MYIFAFVTILIKAEIKRFQKEFKKTLKDINEKKINLEIENPPNCFQYLGP